jgi:hypothetical protein
VQQLSLPEAPQLLLRPVQLRAAVVCPVHAPDAHVPVAQAQAVLQWPVASHVCTAPAPEHWLVPGEQGTQLPARHAGVGAVQGVVEAW